MKEVLDAIYAKLAGSAFSISLGGRIYFQQAPAEATFPYCVYDLVDYLREDTFAYQIATVNVQFAIYAKASLKGVLSPGELLAAQAQLWALYDFCTLTPATFTFVYMKRTLSLLRRNTEANTLQALTQYEIRINK